MIKRIISLALGLVALVATPKLEAQTLPILSLGTDARSAGMAGVQPMNSAQSGIYSSPTDLLYDDARGLRASLLAGLRPSKDGLGATYWQASVGYRLGEQHALMLGMRYLGGVEVPYVNAAGIVKGTIHPRDWGLDLAYSYRLAQQWSLWGRLGYLQSYNSLTADVLTSSLGVRYRSLEDNNRLMDYTLGLSVENLGTKVSYSKDEAGEAQPTQAHLSGSVSLLEERSLHLGAGLRYHFSGLGERKLSYYLGGEWSPIRVLSLRSGYVLSALGNVWSVGLGTSWRGLSLDASYDVHRYKDFNVLRLGLSYRL